MDASTKHLFRIGEIVRVSNIVSPRMVVTKIQTGGGGTPMTVEVAWFNGRREWQTRIMDPRFLSKAGAWINIDPVEMRNALESIRDHAFCREGDEVILMSEDVTLAAYVDGIINRVPQKEQADAAE